MSESGSGSIGTRKIVLLLMMVVACGHFNRVGISVIGTESLIGHFGINPERMGLVYSAFLICYTVAMLPCGWLIDRFGSRAALMFLAYGSVIAVGLTASTVFATNNSSMFLIALVSVRSLLGFINAPLHPAAAQTVFERVDSNSRVLANGLVTFAACVGIASTSAVMGSMIDWFDWPIALCISSVMTLIVAIVWTVGTRSSSSVKARPSHLTHSLSEIWPILTQRSVICITLSYAALGYFQYLFFYWIGYYFESVQTEDRSMARIYTTIVNGAMGVGMVCGGWLGDRVPQRFSPWLRRSIVPVAGMIASGVVFEMGLLASNPQVTVAAFAIAAALIGACEGSFWTMSVALGGRFGATTAGLMNTGCNLGGTLSPLLTPLMSTFFAERFGADQGWRISLSVAGIIVMAGAFLWLGIRAPEKKEAQMEAAVDAGASVEGMALGNL